MRLTYTNLYFILIQINRFIAQENGDIRLQSYDGGY